MGAKSITPNATRPPTVGAWATQSEARVAAIVALWDGIRKSLGEAVATYPEVKRVIAAELRAIADEYDPIEAPAVAAPLGGSKIGPDDDSMGRTFLLARDHFRGTNNAPITLENLRIAVGVSKDAVKKVVYRDHPEWFDKVSGSRGGSVEWRMRSEPKAKPTEPEEE